jgi:hypothetical protein
VSSEALEVVHLNGTLADIPDVSLRTELSRREQIGACHYDVVGINATKQNELWGTEAGRHDFENNGDLSVQIERTVAAKILRSSR